MCVRCFLVQNSKTLAKQGTTETWHQAGLKQPEQITSPCSHTDEDTGTYSTLHQHTHITASPYATPTHALSQLWQVVWMSADAEPLALTNPPTHTHMNSHIHCKTPTCKHSSNTSTCTSHACSIFLHPLFPQLTFEAVVLMTCCVSGLFELSKDHAASNHVTYARITRSVSPAACSIIFGPVANLFLVVLWNEPAERCIWKGGREGKSMRVKLRGDLIMFNQRRSDKKGQRLNDLI